MTIRLLIFLVSAVFSYSSLISQVQVSGTVVDDASEGLPGSVIKALRSDSSLITGVIADAAGQFTLSLPEQTRYILQVQYAGYGGTGKFIPIQVTKEALNLGTIKLRESGKTLAQVDVAVIQNRGEQKGDTTQFNAAAFKTNPDATAEDLVKKMPGVTSGSDGVKVNGETVKKVLVDGKPFFGDDANATLKNVPADMIDKVEVYDRASDQSAFTGFNDGDQQKTINLVTKKSKMVGQFGRIYAGAGVDENQELRYSMGAAINDFKGARRISLLLLSNNVNQQNFSIADLSGAMSGSSQGGGGQGGGRMGGPGSSLMTAPQNGITTTQSAGLNYSDVWGKKITVSGSYFFNTSENLASSNISRNYFTDNNLKYIQTSTSRNFNINHRGNLRLEYTIDSANKIIITPSFNTQNNTQRSLLLGQNSILNDLPLSSTSTDSKNNNKAFDFSNNLLFQHRFAKKGRSLSFNLNNQLTNRDNFGTYYAFNSYSDTSSSILDQNFNTASYTRRTSGNLSYTEPLGENSQVQISYNPSYTESASDKKTSNFNAADNDYTTFNSLLSNKYENYYVTQKAGLSYRYNKNKINFSVGADGQQASLNGIQFYPYTARVNQNFTTLLPNAQLNYKFDKIKNLRVNYRTSTNIPSLTQLQNVIDISNPLQIKTGNDSLKQTFDNNLNLRFGGFNPATSKNLMFFMNLSSSANYISNATYILNRDTILQGSAISAGSQLTKPVNLNGYYNGRAFFVYGFPFKKLKSNFNINGGVNYAHTPSLINDLTNISNSYASNAGLQLSSNISEKLDFNIGINGNYTIVKNSKQAASDNNYYSQTANFKINYMPYKGLVLNSDISHTLYRGLTQSFNQSYFLWNAYVGYKLLKDKSLEARVYVYDILNQNRSISRTITGAYSEDNFTSVLRRYAMFSLTYTFKKFKSGDAPKVETPPGMPSGPPPGMRPPGAPGGGGF